jgi:hypothetical protein
VFFNPLEGMKYVSEVWRVAAEYEVYIENKKIKVKILESPDGMFMGITDHYIKTKGQAGPYKSVYPRSSIEDALVDAIMGLLAFYKPEEAETCWIKDPEF